MSADALRAAYRLGERFVFVDAHDPERGVVVDVLTYGEDAAEGRQWLGQASRSEVCGFMAWLNPVWEQLSPAGRTYQPDLDAAALVEFRPDEDHGFDIAEGCVYVAASSLKHLRTHAYALRHLVEVGGGDT